MADHPRNQMVSATINNGALHDLIPALALLVIGLVGFLLASFWPKGDGRQFLVFAAPSVTLGQTINLVQRAGGGLVQVSRFSNILVASSDRPGFAADLHKAGALIVVAVSVPTGCSSAVSRGPAR
jgi:hypothetical protein